MLLQNIIQSVKTSDVARVILKVLPHSKTSYQIWFESVYKCGLNTGLAH
jgi:hypothetical protein